MAKRKLPKNEIIIEMYQSGLSSGEIAEKLGVSPITVIGFMRRNNIQRRNTKEASLLKVKNGRAGKAKYWLGRKQPKEMIEKRISKQRGANHYLWKGGFEKRDYRNNLVKYKCEDCGGKLNLCIHHVDYDHYNNNPDNLIVLCVSCHLSLHKQAYWDSIHKGEIPKKSNAPIGWNK